MKLRFLLSGLVLSFLPLAAAAQGVMYDCTITRKVPDVNWVSNKTAFVFADDGTVSAIDQATLVAYDGGRVTRARVRANGVTRMRWTVSGLQSTNRGAFPTMTFMADLDRATGQVVIYADLAGYSARVRGEGTCTTRTP